MATKDSLRLTWVRGITDCAGSGRMTTEKLLDKRRVTVSDCGEDGVRLYVGDKKHLVAYFAGEADRFASAAFESVLTGVRADDYPRSIGWLLIRCYYSAFFALHSLLRLHGWACARVAASSLTEINKEISLLFPGTDQMKAGLYLMRISADGAAITCSKMDSALGGSHEMLWSLLAPYVASVTQIVLSDSAPEHQELAGKLDAFMEYIKKSGGQNWFTQVRNRVNYSHEYGAWFPYLNSTTDYDRISAAMSGWLGPPENVSLVRGGGELIEFVSACSFLVSTCCTTVRDLASRSKKASPFRQSSGILVAPR